jgi:formylglycine-generating enzyme required for sulfatase activity
MSIRGSPTTTNGQRSRNLSKQRANYFPRKAFRVEGKQIQLIKKMKQNYRISLCALLLVGAVSMMTAGAQTKPTLAVFVVGMATDAEGDEFAAGLGYDLTRSGAYELVTQNNNTAVATKLVALRTQHAGGTPVDISDLMAWGKANGIGFVQLVVESAIIVNVDASTTVAGREQVAQLVDCSTGKLLGRGTYRAKFVSPEVLAMARLHLEMVAVTGGVFEMGCKRGRDWDINNTYIHDDCWGSETLHWVKVSSFNIGRYQITQKVWRGVMGSLPSGLTSNTAYLGDDKPVIYVSYDDIVGFLAKLNALTGKNYRLPTEAEWEYAARGCSAGNCESYRYSGGNTIENVAYYNQSSGGPTIVGTKSPNQLGIYDMSGNVWEWCSDWYDNYYGAGGSSALTNTTSSSPIVNPTGPNSGSARVFRGGSWSICTMSNCRVAQRNNNTPDYCDDLTGFRLVLP